MAAETKVVESSIQKQLESLPESSSNRSIYKVPEYIREVKRECYQPSIISIGPMYYNTPSLKHSLNLKLNHLKCFLELATHTNGNRALSLSQYIVMIKDWEEEARSYYEEKISLTSNAFIEMMMVDAAFIIYLFMCYTNNQFNIQEVPIKEKITWMVKVKQDIFVEDNQLPFFVLNNLYDIAFGATHPHISFKDLTCCFIYGSSVLGREVGRIKLGKENVEKISGIKHLVDFLLVCHLPSQLRDDGRRIETTLPPSAKMLEAAGVKFKAREGKNLLDIEFSDGVLEIPVLTISDFTEGLFRNIIFFEQCRHYYDRKNSYFVDYVYFLDALIDTHEDVQILVQHGIIENLLGSDAEVATVVNQLTKYTMVRPDFYYFDIISKKLKAHANTRRNKWIAVLRKDYFNHPWSIISVVYLVILLILTTLQVYTGFK